MFPAGLVMRVQTPVACDDVEAAVAIQIPGGHTRPPTGVSRESKLVGNLLERSTVIAENPHGQQLEAVQHMREELMTAEGNARP